REATTTTTPPLHSLYKRRSWAKGISKKLNHIVDQAEKAGKDVVSAVTDAFEDMAEDLKPTVEDIGEAFSPVVAEIAKLLQPMVCSTVAKSLVPFHDASANLFAALNPAASASATTDEQNFFLYHIVGELIHDGIQIFYQATYVPGFTGAGITMGRNVYLRNDRKSAALPTDPGFYETVLLVAHELVHCAQYSAHGYSIAAFGERYLYQWCAAGFSYEGNTFEKSAYEVEGRLRASLADPVAIGYFDLWRGKADVAALGYPSSWPPAAVTGTTAGISELRFQRGTVLRNPAGCYKILSPEEEKARRLAVCTIRPCINDGILHRKGRREITPKCTEKIWEDNYGCRKVKAQWAGILKGAGFTC
ncbi:hypothetical protein GE09DRAFT_1129873, partial [Coniochaeta sp. 2T2.1]